MKRKILILSALLAGALSILNAQDQPAPQKDTINMDTEAKPTQYYDIEDDNDAAGNKKGSTGLILIIAGGAVLLGGAAFVVMGRKKK